jgi:Lon protease-like protein
MAMQISHELHREVPLFPLRTVLFAGGRLPLRIFEPRYTDMVSRCLKEDTGFGVVLIRDGAEMRTTAGTPQPNVFAIGTYARVIDFSAREDGTLGIMVSGGPRFRVLSTFEQPDHLLIGEVEYLPEERAQAVGTEHAPLVEILRQLLKHPLVQRLALTVDFDDARSVSWRLAELLPIEPEIKQSLLQMNLPRERLTELSRLVDHLRN